MQANLPIGVFDSGVGGLTVLKALRARLPGESFLYLGDTARLPYGTKSQSTVSQYALQAAQFLYKQGIKLLVVACNTASSMAIPTLQATFPDIPVVGVIEPGAIAACDVTKSGHIIVAATETTIHNKAYQHAIHNINPSASVIGQACSLLVPLAEEGWLRDEVTETVIGRYLLPYFHHKDTKADCLVLGCTHYPALLESFKVVLADANIAIVDSARTTADAVARELDINHLEQTEQQTASIRYFTTDAPARFAHVAQYFLQDTLVSESIQLVDI